MHRPQPVQARVARRTRAPGHRAANGSTRGLALLGSLLIVGLTLLASLRGPVASVAGEGATLFVAGSAIFGASDPAAAYADIAQAAGL